MVCFLKDCHNHCKFSFTNTLELDISPPFGDNDTCKYGASIIIYFQKLWLYSLKFWYTIMCYMHAM